MSLSGALLNAISGLSAAKRGTELTASNISNANTKGYGKKSAILMARLGSGGVDVLGVKRFQDAGLLSDRRLASAGLENSDAKQLFLKKILNLFGTADKSGSLSAHLSRFESALVGAVSNPSQSISLQNVFTAARELAEKLNQMSQKVQAARETADQKITSQVKTLTSALNTVKDLNDRILKLKLNNKDTSTLEDQRQKQIDDISDIIPIREDPKKNGTVSLVSLGGTTLLATKPAEILFEPSVVITADMSRKNGLLSGLKINGTDIALNEKGPVRGGSLAAQFAIRDELAQAVQTELDAAARNLIKRFQSSSVDATLTAADPGLFTDAGAVLDPTKEVGLARQITINARVDPDNGGNLFRLRDGLMSKVPGTVGDTKTLKAMQDIMSEKQTLASGKFATQSHSLATLSTAILSSLGSDLMAEERQNEYRVSALTQLRELEKDGAVDTDEEAQKMLILEHSYKANARMIKTIDEMLQTILRI